jgi:DNA-binding MarR family transcriptional regulator
MASELAPSRPAGPAAASQEPPKGEALPGDTRTPDFVLIELLFFGYRDFIGEADRVLAHYGFGRAHHRVLHFVNRRPGLTIAELLDILDITKQSLARVLKDLITSGHIESRAGSSDRRQRRLSCTPAGGKLAVELAAMQDQRIRRALLAMPDGARDTAETFLEGLIEPRHRRQIVAQVKSAQSKGEPLKADFAKAGAKA